MDLIVRLDKIILSFFTKLAHSFQRLTGRTNYFLAKVFLFVLMTCVVIDVANYWFLFLGKYRTSILSLIFSSLLVWYFMDTIYNCDKADEGLFSESNSRSKIDFDFFESPYTRMFFGGAVILDITFGYYRDFFLDTSGVFLFKLIHHQFVLSVWTSCY